MVIRGRVQHGVVVLEGGPALPDGMQVIVSCDFAPVLEDPTKKKRVEFPLVHSKHPGSLYLTAERIAEILEEDDVSP